MSDSIQKPARHVQMRDWSRRTMVGAAVGLAVVAPALAQGQIAADGGAQLWLANATTEGGEGGEGGESGAAAVGVDETADLLVRLGKIEAHLLTGMDLLRAGEADAAQAQFTVPMAEIYEGIEAALEAHHAPGFEAELVGLGKARGAEVDVSFQLAMSGIGAARSAIAADPKETLAAVLALTREAAEDFEAGTKAGDVSDLGEYQDARAYLFAARSLAGDLLVSTDERVLGAVGKSVKALDEAIAALPDVLPEGKLTAESGLILAAAARIELAAYQVK
jgi:hypothetical protein